MDDKLLSARRIVDAALEENRRILEITYFNVFPFLCSEYRRRPKPTPEEAFKRWANEMNGCTCSCHEDDY